jgi:hypothetical protein
MSTESDDAAWARTHRACFQVLPLVEMRGNAKIQVGFTIDLYASLPVDKAAGAERIEESKRLWERLRTIVESLRPPEGSTARVEIEPPRTAACLRRENEMEPEIGLRARIFHGDEYFKAATPDESKRMSAVEGKLKEMGLRADNW